MDDRALAIEIAMHFLGLPYIWGGDDPIDGFDCSGFNIEILKSVGRLPRTGDWSARALYKLFKEKNTAYPAAGRLVFFGTTEEDIYHVEFLINDHLTIGASGGGSKANTREDAIKQNAYVKIRPIKGRSNIFAYIDPFI